MSYRELAIDAGARGEDEIRQLAEAIEADHRADAFRHGWCPECGQDGLGFNRYGVCTGCALCGWEPEGEGADS